MGSAQSTIDYLYRLPCKLQYNLYQGTREHGSVLYLGMAKEISNVPQ